ncbi:hypothetical protein FHS83_002426 [Rhizomicrobium palustre]|uniref:Uncharacterized protein n=1 Tax=Rhizomicrobium palustre TaxID=189966 RepID=A0A846MZR3_9PROT|nr:hypothetical protein [Rhizomicrobium palustre]
MQQDDDGRETERTQKLNWPVPATSLLADWELLMSDALSDRKPETTFPESV